MEWSGRRLHLVGIGGAGMSGYALVAAQLGATVSGSDRADSPVLARLRAAGIDARAGHDAANVPDGADVVLSSAVGADNPERVAALERGLNVLSRADLLEQLTALKKVIAVAGAHGKTTTTSMAAHVLLGCGLDPGYLIGGVLSTTGTNAAWGTGEWLVVEADESDRSMLRLHVDVAVLTNVELDHHAAYGSLDELRDAYRAFLARAPEAVVWDHRDLLALRDGPVVPYDALGVVLTDGGSRFRWRGQEVELRVPGTHNAINAAGALEACALAGADPAAAASALADFAGAGRRFERLGTTASGALVVDDYAHHPTEVAATIDAARTLDGAGRVWALFQPHAAAGPRVRRGARARRRRGSPRRLPGARGRRRLPGRHRPAPGPDDRRRRARQAGLLATDLRRRPARPTAAPAPRRRRPRPRGGRRRPPRARPGRAIARRAPAR